MPCLVFLHGLLGSAADWRKLIEKLPHFDCIALDLPYHGKARNIAVDDFEQSADWLADNIKRTVGRRPYVVVGYSLGGRIALYYALQAQCAKGNLQGLVLEGANLGLQSAAEKQARWQHDCRWAQRFATQPPQQVLQDWYRQGVFAHLHEDQREALIRERAANCGENIARMLLATSLAKQPDFRTKVRSNLWPIFYFCGEKDEKFCRMAEQSGLPLTRIPAAGHNAHKENPAAFARQLSALVSAIGFDGG